VLEITAGGEASLLVVQRGPPIVVKADQNREPPPRFAEDAPCQRGPAVATTAVAGEDVDCECPMRS
jgi:hypothetical protein